MSNTNPYYRSQPDRSSGQSDQQFAQQANSRIHQKYHSAYQSKPNQKFQKPHFTQSSYPSVPSYMPVPPSPPQEYQQSYFSQIFDKYKNNKRADDLTAVSLCKNCNQMTESFVIKKNSFIVWIVCIFLLIATYICFFLPFLFDGLKNKHVLCKNCGKTKFVIKAC